MPGVFRPVLDQLVRRGGTLSGARHSGDGAFPVIDPHLKTPDALEASNPNGLVPPAVRALKNRFPDSGMITDIALDPYTSHGQDGLIDASGYVFNDETVAVLARQA